MFRVLNVPGDSNITSQGHTLQVTHDNTHLSTLRSLGDEAEILQKRRRGSRSTHLY